MAGTPLASIDQIVASAQSLEAAKIGIYFLLLEEQIIYVGQSRNIMLRIADHANTKRFDRWAWIPCAIEELDQIERAYLDAFLPPLNRDSTTMRLKGGWPSPLSSILPEDGNLWAGIKFPEANPDDDPPSDPLYEARKEYLRRLRAIKASPSLKLSDFGPSPFTT